MRRTMVRAAIAAVALSAAVPATASAGGEDLWGVYDRALSGATYIDLTHTITPGMPDSWFADVVLSQRGHDGGPRRGFPWQRGLNP